MLGPAPRAAPELPRDAAGEARVSAALSPVDTRNREAVRSLYNDVYLPALAVPSQWTGISGCNPGATSAAYATATIDAVNFFRAMTGLPAALPHRAVKDAKAQAAALIMSANNNLTHFPPPRSSQIPPARRNGRLEGLHRRQ